MTTRERPPGEPGTGKRSGLRARVLEGGALLAVRQAAGLVIGFGGTALLVRAVGPEAYGVYAAAAGLAAWAQGVLLGGVGLELVRRPDDEAAVWDQAFTLLAALASLGTALAVALVPLASAWIGFTGLEGVAVAVLGTCPPWVLTQVAAARLERDLRFADVAVGDLLAQATLFGVALPSAWAGLGPWAPVAGLWASTLVRGVWLFHRSGIRPRPRWDASSARALATAGGGFTLSLQIWQLRPLVAPLVVGHWLGASAVADVALAHKLVDALGFVKSATWRLGLAALAKVRGERLRAAVEEGMTLQVLALGPLLAAFAWLGPALPRWLGPVWEPPVRLFPLLAAGALANALFSLHSSALWALGRNRDVAVFHAVHVAAFAGGAALLVPILGLDGYGWAEIAAVPAYLVVHGCLARAVGSPRYGVAGLLCAGFAAALAPVEVGAWRMLLAFAVLTWPPLWRRLGGLAAAVRRDA